MTQVFIIVFISHLRHACYLLRIQYFYSIANFNLSRNFDNVVTNLRWNWTNKSAIGTVTGTGMEHGMKLVMVSGLAMEPGFYHCYDPGNTKFQRKFN